LSPNDVVLDHFSCKMTLINGANGAGKTTYLKAIALNIILAQIGCFVPCKSFKFTPLNFIFCKAGDQKNIIIQQSSTDIIDAKKKMVQSEIFEMA